jgi:hypothetical protein
VISSNNGGTFGSILANGNMHASSLRHPRLGFFCMLRHHPLPEILTNLRSDIAYYGVNLNQSVVLTRIGFAKGASPWETLYNTAIGNIIVQSAVRVPLKVATKAF